MSKQKSEKGDDRSNRLDAPKVAVVHDAEPSGDFDRKSAVLAGADNDGRAPFDKRESDDSDWKPSATVAAPPWTPTATWKDRTAVAEPQLCRKHLIPLVMRHNTMTSGDVVDVLWCENCGTPAP